MCGMFCWGGYKMSNSGEEDSGRFNGGRLRRTIEALRGQKRGGEVSKGIGRVDRLMRYRIASLGWVVAGKR